MRSDDPAQLTADPLTITVSISPCELDATGA